MKPVIFQLFDGNRMFGKEKVVLNLNKYIHNYVSSLRSIPINVNRYCDNVALNDVAGKWSLKEIIRELKKHYTCIIHTHDYKSLFYGCFIKLFVNRNIKLIYTEHCDTNVKFFTRKTIYSIISRICERLFVNKYIVVADNLSKRTDRITIENGINFDTNNEKQYYCLNDLENTIFRDVIYKNKGSRTIYGIACRLAPEKNLINLIVAMEKLNAHLIIIGEGPQRKELEDTIKTYGLEKKVFLTGIIENVPKYLGWLDAYIQPSLKEGVPIAVLEAAREKIPLLLSKAGGMEKMTNSEHVITINDGSTASIVEAINAFKIQNPKMSGNKVYTHFKKNYNINTTHLKYINVYETLI